MTDSNDRNKPVMPDLSKGYRPKQRVNDGHQPRQPRTGTFGLRPPVASIDVSKPPRGGSAIPPKKTT